MVSKLCKLKAAAEKGEVKESLNHLMAQHGAYGYVLINFDGIPVKHFPENLKAV